MGFIKRFVPLFLLISAMIFVYSMGWHHYLSLSSIADNKESLKSFVEGKFMTSVLLYSLIYILIVAFSLPAAFLVTITGGFYLVGF